MDWWRQPRLQKIGSSQEDIAFIDVFIYGLFMVLNQQWDYYLANIVVKFIGSHVPIEEAVQPWPTQCRLL
jgi:hypothetical protein